VADVLDFIQTVYGYLQMEFVLKLSTRPENFLGDVEVWDKAEMLMTEALNEYSAATGHTWTLNPGDGAFYGPKIDVQVFDALRRAHQCATAQLDFVLPERFNLSYQSAGGEDGAAAATERPVMVHRAVLGSVERMIAILTEHYAGKWPFFLSPRQALVVPVSKTFSEYAEQVQKKVSAAGFYVDVDLSARTLNKMVREAQLSQYNFILVVGAQEAANSTVNVRTRDNAVHGTKSVDALIAEFKRLETEKSPDPPPPEPAAPK
jgi:threonyl-tRNA synthetase